MAALHITSEEFYDLDAIELHFALKMRRELQRAQSRELYEIARLQAVLIVNPTLKTPFKDPRDYLRFSWEEKDSSKKQSPEEMKRVLLGIGLIFGGDKPTGHKKLDDPPTALLNKQQK